MKEALADVGKKGAWSEDQRRELRAGFQAIIDAFDGTLILRGTLLERPLNMASLPLTMEIPFTSKPAAIVVLSATKDSDGSVISMPPVLWSWTPTTTASNASITDIDLLDGEDYTLTILVVRQVLTP